jgi:IS30 family transposase
MEVQRLGYGSDIRCVMKKTYTQPSIEERDKIAILRAQGLSLERIAQSIVRNKSAI